MKAVTKALRVSGWEVLRWFLGLNLFMFGLSKVAGLQFWGTDENINQALAALNGHSFRELRGLDVFLLFFSYSKPYQIGTGLIEIIVALLILVRATWPIGTVVYVAVMVHVLLVDMCFGVWHNGTTAAWILFGGSLLLLARSTSPFLAATRSFLAAMRKDEPAQSGVQRAVTIVYAVVLLVGISSLAEWVINRYYPDF